MLSEGCITQYACLIVYSLLNFEVSDHNSSALASQSISALYQLHVLSLQTAVVGILER